MGSYREPDTQRTQPSERLNSDLLGLRCCCILALLDAAHKGEVETRVGETLVTPCCGKRLLHREGAWQQDTEAGK
jgi:hypothetical protein